MNIPRNGNTRTTNTLPVHSTYTGTYRTTQSNERTVSRMQEIAEINDSNLTQQQQQQQHSLPNPDEVPSTRSPSRDGDVDGHRPITPRAQFATTSAAHTHNHTRGTKGNNKTLQNIAGVAGNVLEWYDFAVFGYFSDVLGDVFFPPQEGHAAIIESFAIFGLAFLCRPIGGILLGYIGDVHGRKKALEISLFLIAFPTFAMG